MSQDTKNFKVSEFACKCGCGHNPIDQRVINMCQAIRDEVGVPVRVNSGCRCEKHNANYIVFNPEQIKSATDNIGTFDNNNPDIYYQAAFNPRKWFSDWIHGKDIDERAKKVKDTFTSSVDSQSDYSFENEETERRYTEARKGIKKATVLSNIRKGAMDLLRSFRTPYSELSENEAYLLAKGEFEKLDKSKSAAVQKVMKPFTEKLKNLTDRQLDLFIRKRLLDDLTWRKTQVPDADLPFGFNDKSLKKEYDKISKVIEREPTVKKAIEDEEKAMAELVKEYRDLAGNLGLKLGESFKNPHYFRHSILEYANAAAMGKRKEKTKIQNDGTIQGLISERLNGLTSRSYLKRYKGSPLDINLNYSQAMGEVRSQMAVDIATMKTLLKIKKEYDIAPKLKEKLKQVFQENQDGPEKHNQSKGMNLSNIIPEGYEIYNPAGSRLIQSANSPIENVLAMALDDISDETGIPINEVLNSIGINDTEIFNQLWIIPKEIKETLKRMSKKRDRGLLGNSAKTLTNWWKKAVLFSPTRNLKYNLRNFTGDLDALIAGNPEALKFSVQALTELIAHFRGKETSQDLKDFLERSGGELQIESMQLNLPFSDSDIKTLQKTVGQIKADGFSLKNIPQKGFNVIKKFFSKEVELTQLRENWLRYAAYLAYKKDIDEHKGTPSAWGASNKKEVMALPDIKDRAYKMSNDLLGNYDEISDVGKNLRDMLIPFWSWQEVNLRRYYKLIRNGLRGDNSGNFAKRLLIGQTAKIPYYAINGAMTFAKISALTMAIQAINRFIFGNDDDKLPNDVKYRPHITLGEVGGKVYYFDRIGALSDAADWLNLDSIFLDAKELANGQQSIGGYMKKMLQAPVSKVIGQLNPMLKMPIELATGRSLYPDAFHSRTIRDNGEYLAQTFGLQWPYRAAMKKPRSDMDELSNLLLYSVDPDEAAYFQTLDKVRQFQERVLDKHFDGFATTKRGNVLRNLKTALRYKDRAAIKRYLKEYAQLDGTKKGLQQSMKAMNPLHGLSKEEQKQFLKWITADDRKYLQKANKYFHALADKYIR